MASADSRACANCGAAPARAATRFCEYCGTELPRAEAPAAPSPYGDLEARFAALRGHPDLVRLMRSTPTAPGLGCGTVFAVVFFAAFIGVGLLIFTGMSRVGAPGVVLLVPLGFVVIGVLAGGGVLRRIGGFARAPLRREPALVVGERHDDARGSGSSSTSYFVTLEFPDGARRELETHGPAAGAMSAGDLGVAYLKGDFLLDFQRLRV